MTLKLYRFEHASKSLYQNNIDFLRMHEMIHNDEYHYPAIQQLKNRFETYLCFNHDYKYWYQKYISLVLDNYKIEEIENILNENFKNMYIEYKSFEQKLNKSKSVIHFFNSKKHLTEWFKKYQVMAILDIDFKLYEYEFEIDFNVIEDFQMTDNQTMIDISKVKYLNKLELKIGDLYNE